jgi:hypothetical protein
MKRQIVTAAMLATVGALALAAAGCGGTVNVSELPLAETFDDCDAGFSMNDEIATVDCTDGQLRILVSKPELSPIHQVPFRFEPSVDGLAVTSAVRLADGAGDVGIGCDASGPGQAGRGYLFLLHRALGAAGVYRLESVPVGDGRAFVDTTWVGFRRLPGDLAGKHALRVSCTRAAGSATALRMAVDGRVVIDTLDREGIWPFRTAVAVVIAQEAETDARFDDLRATRSPSGRQSVPRAKTPGAYRYRIEMMGYDGRPIRDTALGDDFVVVVSSPDVPAGRVVPFKLCVDHAARAVCSPARLDGGTDYATGWQVDPGEESDGRLRLSVRVQGREVASTSAPLRD